MKFLLAALGAAAFVADAHAQTDSFYKGKSITVISGGSGGYDSYTRLLARHMGRFIPGEPNLIVKNMPAAASMAAANTIFNVSAPDGLTFGSFLRQIPFAPLFGDPAAKFDARQFTWLGTSSSFLNDVSLLFIRNNLGIRTYAELKAHDRPVQFGSTGRTSTGDEGARLAAPILGLKLNIVRGYSSTPQILLAMESGELDAMILGISSLSTTKPDWLKPGGPASFIFQFGYGGEGRHPDFPNVPRIDELAGSADDKALFYLLQVPFKIARPFAAPPKLPADRAKILRDAFTQANQDATYLDEAKKLQLDISALPGEAVADIVVESYKLPSALVTRYADILARPD